MNCCEADDFPTLMCTAFGGYRRDQSLKTTNFICNALGQLVAEYDDSAQSGTGGTSYLTSDTLGTPRVITDSSGVVKARHDYLPFGEEIGLVGGRTASHGYITDDVRQKFTQKERDSETGLDYFLARYYVSTQGRFTSVDPVMMTAERQYDPQMLVMLERILAAT